MRAVTSFPNCAEQLASPSPEGRDRRNSPLQLSSPLPRPPPALPLCMRRQTCMVSATGVYFAFHVILPCPLLGKLQSCAMADAVKTNVFQHTVVRVRGAPQYLCNLHLQGSLEMPSGLHCYKNQDLPYTGRSVGKAPRLPQLRSQAKCYGGTKAQGSSARKPQNEAPRARSPARGPHSASSAGTA